MSRGVVWPPDRLDERALAHARAEGGRGREELGRAAYAAAVRRLSAAALPRGAAGASDPGQDGPPA